MSDTAFLHFSDMETSAVKRFIWLVVGITKNKGKRCWRGDICHGQCFYQAAKVWFAGAAMWLVIYTFSSSASQMLGTRPLVLTVDDNDSNKNLSSNKFGRGNKVSQQKKFETAVIKRA